MRRFHIDERTTRPGKMDYTVLLAIGNPYIMLGSEHMAEIAINHTRLGEPSKEAAGRTCNSNMVCKSANRTGCVGSYNTTILPLFTRPKGYFCKVMSPPRAAEYKLVDVTGRKGKFTSGRNSLQYTVHSIIFRSSTLRKLHRKKLQRTNSNARRSRQIPPKPTSKPASSVCLFVSCKIA